MGKFYLFQGSTVNAKGHTETVFSAQLGGTGLGSTRKGMRKSLGLVGSRCRRGRDGDRKISILCFVSPNHTEISLQRQPTLRFLLANVFQAEAA